MAIPADAAFEAVVRHLDDEIVVSGLGTATQEYHRILGADGDRSFHVHSMGTAAAFALGLALAQPERDVWVFDGDGALVLNFGSLLTLASQQPPNLRYVLVNNRRYGIIEGEFLVNARVTDYAAMARAAGIERSTTVTTIEQLDRAMIELREADAFHFVQMDVVASGRPFVKVPYEGPGIKYRFAEQLHESFDIDVLGPLGY